jgi:hypothetical protein
MTAVTYGIDVTNYKLDAAGRRADRVDMLGAKAAAEFAASGALDGLFAWVGVVRVHAVSFSLSEPVRGRAGTRSIGARLALPADYAITRPSWSPRPSSS